MKYGEGSIPDRKAIPPREKPKGRFPQQTDLSKTQKFVNDPKLLNGSLAPVLINLLYSVEFYSITHTQCNMH